MHNVYIFIEQNKVKLEV